MASTTGLPERIATIGHSTRTLDALIEILTAHGVATLVDVRTVPRSRRNAQFNRDTLPASLGAATIAYAHLPALGGHRKPRPDSINAAWRNPGFRGYADHMQTPEFAAGLDALLALARAAGTTAIMCAEAVPWRCHRSLIADALTARGIRVEHLLGVKRAEPHVLTSFARVSGSRVTYPAPAPLALPFDRS